MPQDILSQFYSSLNLPIQDKLCELTRIIDQSGPNRDLQAIFPLLINHIFSGTNVCGWGLRTITMEKDKFEFELLHSFLEPQGPMFRLCYKLLTDPQLKYNLPLQLLPLELQLTLERGRCPLFYADLFNIETQTMNIVALALNPFDYYFFNFTLHLLNNNMNKGSWEGMNTVYFTLVCDYLLHFLPTDPNSTVLPHIPHFTGKVPMVAPLQTANRSLGSPSLLLKPDLSDLNNQHTTTQTESRNEIWRTETVLQVFSDIWMSVDECDKGENNIHNRSYPIVTNNTERVRITRVLVKHIHSFASKCFSDPSPRSAALRKYSRKMMCVRGYHYIKYLVETWPLDSSFRMVLELWLSLIQPWRYDGNVEILKDGFPAVVNTNLEEINTKTADSTYAQFIAENFAIYTSIFQMVLPRFLRLDLSAPKNAIMLFRLGKVFSQQGLIYLLRDLERAICLNCAELYTRNEMTYPYTNENYNESAYHKWGTLAKQSLSELNTSPNFCYEIIWTDNKKDSIIDFLKRIVSSKIVAEKAIQDYEKKINKNNNGFWSIFNVWSLFGIKAEDEISLEECKKVPQYLDSAIHYFSCIFMISDTTFMPQERSLEDNLLDHSSDYTHETIYPHSITYKLRTKATSINYMGDPDLMPITSYECTIVVRILYQITTVINKKFQQYFSRLWMSNDFKGALAREILQKPCNIEMYVKDTTNLDHLVIQQLPARVSLRRLGSKAFLVWMAIGYVIFRLFNFSVISYLIIIIMLWSLFVLIKVIFKSIGISM